MLATNDICVPDLSCAQQLVVAVVALVVGTAVGHKQAPDSQLASGEAAKAQRILEQAGFKAPATESVLVQSDRLRTTVPRFRAAVQDVVRVLASAALPNALNIQSPLVNAGQVARNHHSVLVQFDDQGRPRQGQGQGRADP